MYEHPKLTAFTNTLEALFQEADDFMEDEWGAVFSLHPNRPGRGSTSNPEMDGLFQIIPDFTLGIGSEKGRGYRLSFRTATLEWISPEEREYLMAEAAAFIQRRLPFYFPDRRLEVVRDGKGFKITGDFSLGEA
jgi:hypothetical protein